MAHVGSTLANTERRWARRVLALHAVCCMLGLVFLCVGEQGRLDDQWLLCFALWLYLCFTNVRYLRDHDNPTVGMAPVSVFSLIPAAAVGTRCEEVRWVSTALLVATLVVAVLFAHWFVRLRRAYAHRGDVAADAVAVVLGGAVRNGRPRATLTARLDTAAELWHAHPGITLVLSGGPVGSAGETEENGVPQTDSQTEADVMARYLEEAGVDAAHLLKESRARNTRENVALGFEVAARHGLIGQRCVLTSDYHLYRALSEGRRLGLELVGIPAPTPSRSRLQQWCREVLTILKKG